MISAKETDKIKFSTLINLMYVLLMTDFFFFTKTLK